MIVEGILKYLEQKTNEYEKNKENKEIYTANEIAKIFNVKRNTVSHYINQMVREEKIIKINSRPVYFFHKEAFEKKFFKIDKKIFVSLDELFEPKKEISILDSVIGSGIGLEKIVRKIKTSVLYPSKNGLPIMITGPTGIGKSFLANLIYEYSIEAKVIKENAPFINFNCAQYFNNPELLSSNLFGYAKGTFTGADRDTPGMLEMADGGILFLDEVHRLSSEGQEKLFTFIDKGIVTRMGATGKTYKSNVRLIFATTEDLNKNFLNTFLRRIPIVVDIPDFNKRSEKEKLHFIYRFFIEEVKMFDKSIEVSGNVLELLLNYSYKGNIGELKNEIKYLCATVHSEQIESKDLRIRVRNLPDKFLKRSNKSLMINRKGIRLNKDSRESSLVYEKPYLNNLKMDIEKLESIYILNKNSDLKEQLNIYSEKMIDKLVFQKINDYDSNLIKFIKNIVSEVIKQIEAELRIKLDKNIEIILVKYIFFTEKYKIKLNKKTSDIIEKLYKKVQEEYKKEIKIVMLLDKWVENRLDVKLEKLDYIIISAYLNKIKLNNVAENIKGIILAHGYSTASSIGNTVNRLLNVNVFEAFDMPLDTSTLDIIKGLKEYIQENEISKGLIILVDMGSLREVYREIQKFSSVPVGIINNVSTQMALMAGSLIKNELNLEEIMIKLEKNIKNEYKTVYPNKIKKKAIVSSCITGIGTAKQLQKLLKKSIPKELEIEVLICEYSSIKTDEIKNSIFEKYEVLGIISTLDPEVIDIEYISLDELISGSGEKKLEKIFEGFLDRKEIKTINSNIIRNFSLESIVSAVTILDPSKILLHIEEAIMKLEELLKQTIPNNKKVILYIHISCLIERLIRKAPIEIYKDIEKFGKCQRNLIKKVRIAFSGIEEIYNVNLNIEEIGYIYDIISGKTS